MCNGSMNVVISSRPVYVFEISLTNPSMAFDFSRLNSYDIEILNSILCVSDNA